MKVVRPLVDQVAWANPDGMTRITEMSRDQLLDVIEHLLQEKERGRREKTEILDLLAPPRCLPRRSWLSRWF